MFKQRRLAVVIFALMLPVAIAITLVVQARGTAQTDPLRDLAHAPQPADVAVAAREAARAVMAKKAELKAACWTPLLAKQAEPTQSQHMLRATFDPEGHEVSRTVDDVPGRSRADVAECLRALPLELEINARDKPTTVAVTLAFP
jgi:hypothetical protein